MSSIKFPAPSLGEVSNPQPQTTGPKSLKFGAWNFAGALRLVLGGFFAGATLAPTRSSACTTCFGGDIDSPMADGMNWGIFTLLAIIGTVLLTFLTFLIHIIRKSEALTVAAEKSLHSSKV